MLRERLFLIVFWTGLIMEEKRGNWKKQEWLLISQITDYFSVMNEIEHLLSENARLASLLHCSTSNTGSEKSSCTGLSTSSFVSVLRHYFKCRTKCFSTSPRCETPRSGSKVCNILVRLYWTFSL